LLKETVVPAGVSNGGLKNEGKSLEKKEGTLILKESRPKIGDTKVLSGRASFIKSSSGKKGCRAALTGGKGFARERRKKQLAFKGVDNSRLVSGEPGTKEGRRTTFSRRRRNIEGS